MSAEVLVAAAVATVSVSVSVRSAHEQPLSGLLWLDA